MENVTLVAVSAKDQACPIRRPIIPKKTVLNMEEPSLGVKFLSAGIAACIGDLLTFPLDTAKVRLQIQGEGGSAVTGSNRATAAGLKTAAAKTARYHGVVGTVRAISRQEGPRALYNGLAAGLQRQMCFASVRIGLYDGVKQVYSGIARDNGFSGNGIGIRLLAGCTTGAMAVGCAQPTDVVKVRFQAQKGMSSRYPSVMSAYRIIGKEEGIRGLWKGTMPNVTRNCVVNCCELVSYDLIKTKLIHYQMLSDSMPCHFVSATGAGFVTTVVASPVDVVKTRFMNSSPGSYSGVLDCAAKMFRSEGPAAFYKGFMPSFMRLASWNVVMFVCFEQLKRGLQGVDIKKSASSFQLPNVQVPAVISINYDWI